MFRKKIYILLFLRGIVSKFFTQEPSAHTERDPFPWNLFYKENKHEIS